MVNQYDIHFIHSAAAAAAKSLQSCPTLCDPIDSSPPGSPIPGDSPGKNTGVGCHFLLQCLKVKSESVVAQSCPTLRDPMDWSLPGSSAHGIFQSRVLEWGAIAFSVHSLSCVQLFMTPWTVMPGASMRSSARGKSHEEGGLAYTKVGSSLRSPPGNSRASTPKTRVCLLYCFVLSPTPLTLRGAVPHHLFRRRS